MASRDATSYDEGARSNAGVLLGRFTMFGQFLCGGLYGVRGDLYVSTFASRA